MIIDYSLNVFNHLFNLFRTATFFFTTNIKPAVTAERQINIDYSKIKHISTETKEKLEKVRPTNLAQASRIGGVKPADISVLMVMLGK